MRHITAKYLREIGQMTWGAHHLQDCGQKIWGDHWKARLAERRGVTRSAVTRWQNGSALIPLGLKEEMEKAGKERQKIIDQMKSDHEVKIILTAQTILKIPSFEKFGRRLWGDGWEKVLVKRLAVDVIIYRTVIDWRNGKGLLPSGLSAVVDEPVNEKLKALLKRKYARKSKMILTDEGRRELAQVIMTAQYLQKFCQHLWGNHWEAALVKRLKTKRPKLTRQTVYNWRDGKSPLPPWLSVELENALYGR